MKTSVLATAVRAACTAGDLHLACSYPQCACKIVPKQIAAALSVAMASIGLPPRYRVLNDGPGREVVVCDDDEECGPTFPTRWEAVAYVWANYIPPEEIEHVA